MKYVYKIAIFIIGIFLIWQFFLKTDTDEKIEEVVVSPNGEIIKHSIVNITKDSTKNKLKEETLKYTIPSYKDVFKEKKEKSILGLVHEEQELEEMEKDSNELIIEAEAFIKKHNLNISEYDLSEEEKEKINKTLNKLKKEINSIDME